MLVQSFYQIIEAVSAWFSILSRVVEHFYRLESDKSLDAKLLGVASASIPLHWPCPPVSQQPTTQEASLAGAMRAGKYFRQPCMSVILSALKTYSTLLDWNRHVAFVKMPTPLGLPSSPFYLELCSGEVGSTTALYP